MEKGFFQVYTGDGKGKTTASLGLALRALGAGLSVYMGQFIKGMRYSEIAALERLADCFGKDRVVVAQYGRGCFIKRDPDPEDLEAARSGFAEAADAVRSRKYDLVILDEINVAISYGLVEEAKLLELAVNKPGSVELVATGRYATDAVIAAADLVSEMREIKHYYKAGVEARTGIER